MGHVFTNAAAPVVYASAVAAASGLRVSIEMARCLSLSGEPERLSPVWRGTAEQFARLWFFSPGDLKKIDSFTQKRWLHPGWLRGHMYREGPDHFRFVVEFGWGLTPQMERSILGHARADAGYQKFLSGLLNPVNLEEGV